MKKKKKLFKGHLRSGPFEVRGAGLLAQGHAHNTPFNLIGWYVNGASTSRVLGGELNLTDVLCTRTRTRTYVGLMSRTWKWIWWPPIRPIPDLDMALNGGSFKWDNSLQGRQIMDPHQWKKKVEAKFFRWSSFEH